MRIINLILLLFLCYACKSIMNLDSCKENDSFKTKYFSSIQNVENYVKFTRSIVELEYVSSEDFNSSLGFISGYSKVSFGKTMNFASCYTLRDFLDEKKVWLKWYNDNKCTVEYPKLKNNQFLKNNLIYEIVNDSEVKIVTSLSEDKILEIPNTLNYKKQSYVVTSIGHNAFNHSKFTIVEIPNTIKTIHSGAFFGCKELKSIKIPNSVTFIGEKVFKRCEKLGVIKISNSVISIGNSAFSNCYELKSIKIPNSVKSIGQFAFSECRELDSIQIPNSVNFIGRSCFEGCESLISVKLSESLTEIKEATFYKSYSLELIEIPKSLTVINEFAFKNCLNLKTIICKTKNPNKISVVSGAFERIPETAILYIPSSDCKNTYKKSEIGKYFKNIKITRCAFRRY